MYAFSGETRSETGDDSRDVHCLSASLSEHDLDKVIELSARAFTYTLALADDIQQTRLLTRLSSHNAQLGEGPATEEARRSFLT